MTVHCKDTRIVVNVNTNRPFSGRIYALGRSETCNVDVINSDQFRLDLTMGGQDCNTQSAVSFIVQFLKLNQASKETKRDNLIVQFAWHDCLDRICWKVTNGTA